MKVLFLAGFFAVQFSAHADSDFDEWLSDQSKLARRRIVENIAPADGLPGAVLASPSRENPDYYYHWVRDAALTFGGLGLDRGLPNLKMLFAEFLSFTKLNQNNSGTDGLGEPKYYVDGSVYTGPWGRPQNDGPALRAGVLILNIDLILADTGLEIEEVWPVIERDLDYVSEHIYSANFDLWEENFGQHFYTRMTHRWGLRLGSELASALNYHEKAAWYASQAAIVESLLQEHFRPDFGQIVENIHNLDRKPSGLDAATVLAVNHTKTMPFISYMDPLLLETVTKLVDSFTVIYPINQKYSNFAPGIGRYPEDVYDGGPSHYGNPWFLTTIGLGEFFYELSREMLQAPYVWVTPQLSEFLKRHASIEVAPDSYLAPTRVRSVVETLIGHGDLYLQRVRFHADVEGRMSEQMDRFTGYMRSAHDLTWSYVSFLTAAKSRELVRWALYGAN